MGYIRNSASSNIGNFVIGAIGTLLEPLVHVLLVTIEPWTVPAANGANGTILYYGVTQEVNSRKCSVFYDGLACDRDDLFD